MVDSGSSTFVRSRLAVGALVIIVALGWVVHLQDRDGTHVSTRTGATTTVAPPNDPPASTAPPASGPTNIYAAAGANMLNPIVASVPYRIYVPDSAGSDVQVIDPNTFKVIDTYTTGLDPQHVVPAWDLRTLYAANTLANTLTPIDPVTGKPGKSIPVADPYNLYFTPDGSLAIVVAEAQKRLDFVDPHTFATVQQVPVDCAGVDHVDFSADGSFLIATCEFSARLVRVDVATRKVTGYLDLAGSSPQDIKLDPTGRTFYVADKNLGGVFTIDAATFTKTGFITTGIDTHGLYPSRDATQLYVSNRGSGSVTVIDFATNSIVARWDIPGGGSPDMGGVSPDGKVLWLSGRYDKAVYALSTTDGHLIAKVAVGDKPHGLCVWPQPGRYSLGHTGVMR
ncbi:MAG TPA: YncE family protein [Acidimicrobiales bacterium]|nr:YncE family protein [Acidimicrobiales bacterium]